MASPKLRPILIALALLPAACRGDKDERLRDSVTVKLPPARAATPSPGFSLDAPDKRATQVPGDDAATASVRDLARAST